jgi:23S rRNA (cytidine1920-2'-O)/16S rRNA (cytidine1409-2'-O)-methyltransferase
LSVDSGPSMLGKPCNLSISEWVLAAWIKIGTDWMKTRLDKLLVERGLAPTRERAQAMVVAGRVLVNEQKVDKPGTAIADDAVFRLLGDDPRYVGRGGLKLEAALKYWQIDLATRFCIDVGASTGGFTDCMLQHGAARVLAVDTGYGQIAQSLRSDARVSLMERTNARLLKPGDLPEGISFLAMDVSFISATLVLPAVFAGIGDSLAEAVVLVKPQFDAGREYVGKGGIVRDPVGHRVAIDRVRGSVTELGGREIEVIDSPILGAEGNKEFLLHAKL